MLAKSKDALEVKKIEGSVRNENAKEDKWSDKKNRIGNKVIKRTAMNTKDSKKVKEAGYDGMATLMKEKNGTVKVRLLT